MFILSRLFYLGMSLLMVVQTDDAKYEGHLYSLCTNCFSLLWSYLLSLFAAFVSRELFLLFIATSIFKDFIYSPFCPFQMPFFQFLAPETKKLHKCTAHISNLHLKYARMPKDETYVV